MKNLKELGRLLSRGWDIANEKDLIAFGIDADGWEYGYVLPEGIALINNSLNLGKGVTLVSYALSGAQVRYEGKLYLLSISNKGATILHVN